MSTLSETKLERDAMSISPNARLRLAARLLASVPNSSCPALSERAALDLAEARASELDSGKVGGLDYQQEIKHIRALLIR